MLCKAVEISKAESNTDRGGWKGGSKPRRVGDWHGNNVFQGVSHQVIESLKAGVEKDRVGGSDKMRDLDNGKTRTKEVILDLRVL